MEQMAVLLAGLVLPIAACIFLVFCGAQAQVPLTAGLLIIAGQSVLCKPKKCAL